jgi:molybdate transport system permease protein
MVLVLRRRWQGTCTITGVDAGVGVGVAHHCPTDPRRSHLRDRKVPSVENAVTLGSSGRVHAYHRLVTLLRTRQAVPARRAPAARSPLTWSLTAPAAVAVGFLLLPLLGLLVKAPWRNLPALLTDAGVFQALRLSLVCATSATAGSLLLGVPLAWVLARTDHPASGVLRALVTLPLVLPPIVGGVALLYALGRKGLVGHYLDAWFGITLPFTTAGVIVAETFVAMPFLVVTVEGALRSADPGLEEAALTMGSRPFATFRRVTLPLIAPSLVAGSVLAWARALGEFGATITFAGNFPGTTQTMPLAVYLALEHDPDAAVALSLVLLAVSVAALALLRDRWLRPGSRPGAV